MKDKFYVNYRLAALVMTLVCLVLNSTSPAVSSKVTRHSSSSDLLKGEIKDVVIGSRGTIELGRSAKPLIEGFEELEDVWSINSIVVSGGTIYFGTSPNGGIYKYSLNKMKKVYPVEPENQTNNKQAETHNDKAKPGVKTVEAEKYLSNEHIFAMATDVSGQLLAGISGENCGLYRLKADKMEVIFELKDAKYIFAIATDDSGNIYLGTGPEGKVYRLDPFGKDPQVIYEAKDKNILSLTIGQDGFVYAGSDGRGLIYKINPRTKTATVLYDSDQPEITALLLTKDSELYAAATLAKVVQTQTKFAAQLPFTGRPEVGPQEEEGDEQSGNTGENDGGLTLKIANTKKGVDDKTARKPPLMSKGTKPAKASSIYKITKDGFVTDIFSEAAVFFCLVEQNTKLLVGTGNSAQLFSIDAATEQQAIIYEDDKASQITAVTVVGEDIYLGTANPAKLIKLVPGFASEGTYASDLIDADQPARWGKLQIEADIPKGCKVLLSSRSGNVKDINDPTFSEWTEPTTLTEPTQLRCPLGRFCQYKLILQSEDGLSTPLIREVAVASSIPNLAPKVESVSVEQVPKKEGALKISYKAKDANDDKLIYTIDFRKLGRTNWIKLKDELEEDNFEWDSRTVEDGLYEVRVTASDERGNTTTTKLTDSRISEPVVIDNTGPVIEKHSSEKGLRNVTLKLQVKDEFSAIGKLDYTIDSNEQWTGTIPDDLVYDTTEENFTIVLEKLEAGEHIIAVRVSDDIGNTTYKTFEVNPGY